MQPRTRATLLRLHRWIGLGLALLLLIQGLTGALLVFREEIEPVLHPRLLVQPTDSPASVQLLADQAEKARPEARLDRLAFSQAPGRAAIARLRDPGGEYFYVALDPYRGTVLYSGGISAWPTELLFTVHNELVAGKAGNTIVGIEGIALAWLVGFGLATWWPGSRRLRQGFRVVPGTPDRLVRSLHRSAGGAFAVLLLATAATGIILVFKAPLRDMSGAVAKPEPKVALRPDAPLLSFDRAMASARTLTGNAALVELRLAGERGQLVTVQLDDEHVLRPNAVNQVFVDRYSGRVVGRYQPALLPASNTILDWSYTIHTGEALGLFGRLLALGSGIALLLFAGSGSWLWRSRTRRARASRNAKSTPHSAELKGQSGQ